MTPPEKFKAIVILASVFYVVFLMWKLVYHDYKNKK